MRLEQQLRERGTFDYVAKGLGRIHAELTEHGASIYIDLTALHAEFFARRPKSLPPSRRQPNMPNNPNDECPFCHLFHTIQVPYIHLNGTAAKELRQDLALAIEATRSAIERLEGTMPAGRDYFLDGREAIRLSRRQHAARMDRLQEVAKELEEMRDHVQAVIDFMDREYQEMLRPSVADPPSHPGGREEIKGATKKPRKKASKPPSAVVDHMIDYDYTEAQVRDFINRQLKYFAGLSNIGDTPVEQWMGYRMRCTTAAALAAIQWATQGKERE